MSRYFVLVLRRSDVCVCVYVYVTLILEYQEHSQTLHVQIKMYRLISNEMFYTVHVAHDQCFHRMII